MRHIFTLFAFAGLLLSVGCQSGARDTVNPIISASQPGVQDQEIPTPDRIEANVTDIPERVPPTEAISPVVGEVPTTLLESVIMDLSERTGIARESISVIQGQQIVWDDGSLGCPQPGIFYTQAQVNGYWIILEADGVRFDYRASDSGYFFLCEGGLPPVIPRSTPDS